MKSILISTFLSPIKARLLYAVKISKWRKMNKHNLTTVNEYCPIDNVTVGKETYGKLNVHWYGDKDERLEIGSFCSIADNVDFILGGEHDYRRLTTYPFNERIYKTEFDGISKGIIKVEDDVWIGFGSTILSGVTIGKGSVIGARSIVTRDVPPYSVWVGNKVIKKRFSDDVIDKLVQLDLNDIDYEKFREYYKAHITSDNVDEIISAIKK